MIFFFLFSAFTLVGNSPFTVGLLPTRGIVAENKANVCEVLPVSSVGTAGGWVVALMLLLVSY